MILGHLRQNAVAYLALVVALSTGTAYAAGIANGSVTTKKLANNAVTSSKLKNNAVKSGDIKSGTVNSDDIGTNAVYSLEIGDGSVTTVDIQDGTLISADVKDDTLTRADINDGVVPADADVFNSTAVPGGPAPAVTPLPGQNTFSFTTERNGKLNIEFFAGELSVDCGAGNQGQVAIFIDGAFQPGTLTNAPAPANSGAMQIVTNQQLSAGAHTLSTTEYCLAGINAPVNEQRVTWQVEILAR